MPDRSATSSSTQKPMLWGVRAYRIPGLPSPAMQQSPDGAEPTFTVPSLMQNSSPGRKATRLRSTESYFFFPDVSAASSSFLPFFATSGSAPGAAAAPPVSAVVVASSALNETTCEMTASGG